MLDTLLAILSNPNFVAAAGFLVAFLLARHPLLGLRDLLHARAEKVRAESPKVAEAEELISDAAAELDAFLSEHGQDVEDLVDPAKRAAAEAHLEIAAKAQAKSAITSAIAKATTLTMLLLAVGFASCSHIEPALVTRDTIVTADKAFVATAEVMDTIKPQLTAAQWLKWTAFEARFKTSFHAARILYDDAIAAQLVAMATDGGTAANAEASENLKAAASLITSFISQLAEFEDLVHQLAAPAGGAS